MKAVARAAPIVAVLALVAWLYLGGGIHYFSLESLRAHQAALEQMVERHPVETFLLYVGAYALVCAACLPLNLVATLAGGLMFGVWLGGVATVIGAGLGSVVAYYVVRTSLGAPLLAYAKRHGGALQKIVEGFGRNAFSYVLSLRLIPVFPFWMVSLAAGVASPPLAPYVGATVLGVIPGCFIYAGLGAGLAKAFASGEPLNLSIIFRPQIILPLVGLAALSLLPVAIQRLRASRS